MKKGDIIQYGLYDDEQDLLKAIDVAKNKDLEIADVFTPFPVHGLDKALGMKESRLHIVGFLFGALGLVTAFGGMSWISVSDWPIVFGGKPFWAALSYIPITFELTVLFCAIGVVVTFYLINGLGLGVRSPMLDRRITDDKFCIAFDVTVKGEAREDISEFFNETGATTVNTKLI